MEATKLVPYHTPEVDAIEASIRAQEIRNLQARKAANDAGERLKALRQREKATDRKSRPHPIELAEAECDARVAAREWVRVAGLPFDAAAINRAIDKVGR